MTAREMKREPKSERGGRGRGSLKVPAVSHMTWSASSTVLGANLFLKVPQHLTVHLEIIMLEPLKAEGLT